jgi:hypothetical protein
VTKKPTPAFLLAFFLAGMVILSSMFSSPVQAGNVIGPLPQVATETPSGPMAEVIPGNEEQINLRSGPSTKYEKVGVLLVGQRVPAIGRSPAGEWILVEYPGVPGGQAWVYSAYVKIDPPVQLPIVEPPPTPTLQYTLTVDPTLAARFIVTEAPTRLPTFTPPPALVIPTFTAESGAVVGNLPMGLIIIGLAALGILFGFVSFVQGR